LGSALAAQRLQAQDSATRAPQASDMHRPTAEQTAGEAPPEAAVDHYMRGRKYYLEGRYRDALTELKAALEYDPNSADLIFNVARVYENLGEFDEAIAHYQSYIEHLAPDAAEERDRTDKTIRRLQGAKQELAQRATERNAEQAQRPHAGRADFAFWLTGGAAVGLLAAGGVSGVLALKKTDDVAAFVVGSDGPFSQRDKLAKQADRFALAADLLLAGGAVALTGAALLYFLRDSEPESEQTTSRAPKLSFAFDSRGAQLGVHGVF
jgi:tetratricopeptide (TPR) repeat protein